MGVGFPTPERSGDIKGYRSRPIYTDNGLFNFARGLSNLEMIEGRNYEVSGRSLNVAIAVLVIIADGATVVSAVYVDLILDDRHTITGVPAAPYPLVSGIYNLSCVFGLSPIAFSKLRYQLRFDTDNPGDVTWSSSGVGSASAVEEMVLHTVSRSSGNTDPSDNGT